MEEYLKDSTIGDVNRLFGEAELLFYVLQGNEFSFGKEEEIYLRIDQEEIEKLHEYSKGFGDI